MESTIILSDIRDQFRSGLAEFYSAQEIMQLFSISTEYLLNYAKIDTFLRAGEPISAETAEKYNEILERLRNWEPIQYIIGYTWFYGLTLKVDRRVLIPRQETEELVQWIINSEKNRSVSILDIGTGSGCIALSLAVNMHAAAVSACDISSGALAIASHNALLNKVKVNLFKCDVLDDAAALPEKFGVIVSNPPYVRNLEKAMMKSNVLDYEPERALFVPDHDPLIFYKRIALLGRKYLKDGGCLYLEINEHFPRETVRLLECTGFYGIEVKNDLNGKPRMIRARK
ncbi:MAG TPA: peptide chain release factor N(5)-glutamine methyltransferase [Bacteroidales bacterium]|jgi:release factor glutamine methyltransferase|nr:peptide chain release factor N(5)-glutamine methyltransferase [Bacteroidales bacterium]